MAWMRPQIHAVRIVRRAGGNKAFNPKLLNPEFRLCRLRGQRLPTSFKKQQILVAEVRGRERAAVVVVVVVVVVLVLVLVVVVAAAAIVAAVLVGDDQNACDMANNIISKITSNTTPATMTSLEQPRFFWQVSVRQAVAFTEGLLMLLLAFIVKPSIMPQSVGSSFAIVIVCHMAYTHRYVIVSQGKHRSEI